MRPTLNYQAVSRLAAFSISKQPLPSICRSRITSNHISRTSQSIRCYRRPQSSSPPREARAFAPSVAAILALGGVAYYLLTPSTPQSTTLNKDTFVPYTVISRENISPTTFIVTAQTQNPENASTYLKPGSGEWRFPQWSVEFKQPEVQIARHYTPLPPLEGEDTASGNLRFYVRAVPGGEMSSYLGRLSVGRQLWLRGPHSGFDIANRLGHQKHVVFLAGGTGIVPGMQVANAVLGADATARVNLLWAIRKNEELQSHVPQTKRSWWGFLAGSQTSLRDVGDDIQSPSAIGRELAALKARYGDRLAIKVAVDEDRTFIQERDIQAAISSVPGSHTWPADESCRFHSQLMHTVSSEFEEPGGSCQCNAPIDNTGKSLILVSGPEGFVSHLSGPKAWVQGIETQGAVGGLIGKMQRSDQSLKNNWIVLKL